MIELPETYVLADQINQTLVSKTIVSATANTHPHAFAWYTNDPATYGSLLTGKKITRATPGTAYTCGGHVEVLCEDMLLVITTPIKYHPPGEKLPKTHQLLLEFNDGSYMSCTVQMWGAMLCYPADTDGPPYDKGYTCNKAPTPYDAAFDKAYFENLWQQAKPGLSIKAFLATEQRIPGFGNGVLHDVLWNAGIHPKRKLETFSALQKEKVYNSIKNTLSAMKDQGGRDTEKDLFNQKGGYKTILSKNTLSAPCSACGSQLVREAYLGGNIYYCPLCQE